MNIKEFAEQEGLDETVPSLVLAFPECSPVVLGGLVGQLGEFGTYCFLTTVKEYRKKLNLKGFADVEVNVIKEISELEYGKFLEVYGVDLQPRLEDKTNDFWKRFNQKKKASYDRAKPTAAGGAANDDRQPGNYQYWVRDEQGNWSRGKSDFDADNENAFPLISKRTPGETRDMDPNQLASFLNIIDRIVTDIQMFYRQFLNDPSKPVALQKKLSNFADKEDRVKMIVTIAKPLPFAFSTHETHTLESTTPRIKLGALKLLCLETIASLGRALELKEYPDAVIDGFTPVIIKNVRATAGQMITNQTVALHWYIPVSEIAAIYFQIEIAFSRDLIHPLVFRQAPKYKE